MATTVRLRPWMFGGGLVLLASAALAPAVARAHTELAAFIQPETRDASGRITVEAAAVHVITCDDPGENGQSYHIYQFIYRDGFRAIRPPEWGSPIGGQDYPTYADAVHAACSSAPDEETGTAHGGIAHGGTGHEGTGGEMGGGMGQEQGGTAQGGMGGMGGMGGEMGGMGGEMGGTAQGGMGQEQGGMGQGGMGGQPGSGGQPSSGGVTTGTEPNGGTEPGLGVPNQPMRIGCYADQGVRDLNRYGQTSATNTPKECVSTCATQGYLYAGVQYGTDCFCGNRYGSYGPAENCDMPCAGNPSETCGGIWANEVWSTGVTR